MIARSLLLSVGGAAALAAALALTNGADTARAEGGWRVVPMAPTPPTAVDLAAPEAAPDGPPGATVVRQETGDVRAAWYAEPTRRYGHGVLGDAVEAGALVVLTADDAELRLRLPESEVFEDVAPRLADLDQDGRTEIVTIRASVREGAAVTIYGVREGRLVERATTPFYGRPNRWLNVAAIAPFAGGDALQIAYVETPHIGGVLRLLSFEDGRLTELASATGFSNHAIGSPVLDLAEAVDFGAGRPTLAIPANGRERLRVVEFVEGDWIERAVFDLDAEILRVLGPRHGRREIRILTDDGVYLLEQP